MTDISITAANVVAGADAKREYGKAGAAITAGQVVYRESAGTYKLADTNDALAIVRRPTGIALNGAAVGQPVAVITNGSVTIGGTLVGGTAYYLGGTPGAIVPVADLAAGDRPALLGMATSATVLYVDILAPDVALHFGPANTVAPAITGTAKVGETLTVTNGTWTGTPTPTYTRAWFADGVVIDGATATTYALTSAEEGKVITVEVTASNAVGSAVATSNATTAVMAA